MNVKCMLTNANVSYRQLAWDILSVWNTFSWNIRLRQLSKTTPEKLLCKHIDRLYLRVVNDYQFHRIIDIGQVQRTIFGHSTYLCRRVLTKSLMITWVCASFVLLIQKIIFHDVINFSICDIRLIIEVSHMKWIRHFCMLYQKHLGCLRSRQLLTGVCSLTRMPRIM